MLHFERCILTSQTEQTKGSAKGNGQFSGSDGSKILQTFQREKDGSQEGKEIIEFFSSYVNGAMVDKVKAGVSLTFERSFFLLKIPGLPKPGRSHP